MDKKAIKKELDEVIIQIKNNSKDAKFADKLIDKAMSLKGQLDVEEVELIIPASDVVKRYSFGSFEFLRLKSGIGFHVFNSLYTKVYINCAKTYQILSEMLDRVDTCETNSDEEYKKATGLIVSAVEYNMSAILITSTSDAALFKVASSVLEEYNELQKKYLENPELQEETHEENAKFESDNQMLNKIVGADA